MVVMLACLSGGNAIAFSIGDVVQANGNPWVRQTAGGTHIGEQATGRQGTVIGGPTVSQIGGTGIYYNWYNINWPSAPDGWVADVGLILAPFPAPTLTSISQKCDGATPGMEIQWSAVAGASNYEIYRNGVLIYTTVTAGTTFWNVGGLTAGLSYSFQVKAKSGSRRSGFSNSLSTTAPNCTVFGAPTLNSAVQKCNGTTPGIEIQWSAVSGASGYDIYRDGVFYTTTTGTVFWNYGGLTTGQSYSYQVKAKNGSTTSGFSNSRSTIAPICTVSGAPPLTSIIQKCDGTTPGIEIQWSAVAGANNYEI